MRLAVAFGTNLIGQGARLAIALLTVPLFASYFGAARFGTYYFLLALMPYFQVHALAVGRQVTAFSAQADTAPDDTAGRRSLRDLGASAAIGAAISAVLTAAFFLLYPWMVQGIEGYESLAQEIDRARPWAAAIVVLDVVIVLQTAQIEGRRAFLVSNAVQVAGQFAALILPLTVLIYDGSFNQMIAGVALGRAAQVLLALRWAPLLPVLALAMEGFRPPRDLGLDFGMLTVSSICNAISRTLDRILIGMTASASALYFYAAPMGGTARLAMLGRAMAVTLAPRFAVSGDEDRTAQAGAASDATLAIIFPICIAGIAFAPILLTLWVDADFAVQALVYFRLGLVAVLGAAIAQVPAILLQSTGRAKLVTIQHLAELLPFAAALYLASTVSLTAVAWVVAVRTALAGIIHMLIAKLPGRSVLAMAVCTLAAFVCVLAAPAADQLPKAANFGTGVTAMALAVLLVHMISPATMRFIWQQIAVRLKKLEGRHESGVSGRDE